MGTLLDAIYKTKEYISMWNLLTKKLSLGKDGLEITFVWYDVYTKQKIIGNSLFENMSMTYNLAVLYSYLAESTKEISIEKSKEAGTYYLIAAWIFRKLKENSKDIKLGDDLTEENISMHESLMMAYGQLCGYNKVLLTRNSKYKLLAKLAIQAASYFEQAYKCASSENLDTF